MWSYLARLTDVLTPRRPQYTVFPDDPKGFSLDEQYYIGNSGLLVKPVTASGVTETTVYLADAQVIVQMFAEQELTLTLTF
jgi:alpha-glucosidase (family GH31 glycosyl hydrolase)